MSISGSRNGGPEWFEGAADVAPEASVDLADLERICTPEGWHSWSAFMIFWFQMREQILFLLRVYNFIFKRGYRFVVNLKAEMLDFVMNCTIVALKFNRDGHIYVSILHRVPAYTHTHHSMACWSWEEFQGNSMRTWVSLCLPQYSSSKHDHWFFFWYLE